MKPSSSLSKISSLKLTYILHFLCLPLLSLLSMARSSRNFLWINLRKILLPHEAHNPIKMYISAASLFKGLQGLKHVKKCSVLESGNYGNSILWFSLINKKILFEWQHDITVNLFNLFYLIHAEKVHWTLNSGGCQCWERLHSGWREREQETGIKVSRVEGWAPGSSSPAGVCFSPSIMWLKVGWQTTGASVAAAAVRSSHTFDSQPEKICMIFHRI